MRDLLWPDEKIDMRFYSCDRCERDDEIFISVDDAIEIAKGMRDDYEAYGEVMAGAREREMQRKEKEIRRKESKRRGLQKAVSKAKSELAEKKEESEGVLIQSERLSAENRRLVRLLSATMATVGEQSLVISGDSKESESEGGDREAGFEGVVFEYGLRERCGECHGFGWTAEQVGSVGEMEQVQCLDCAGYGYLPKEVEIPRADWAKAPDWANWWAVDSSGQAVWFRREPQISYAIWICGLNDGHLSDRQVDIPLGIDWRVLKERKAV